MADVRQLLRPFGSSKGYCAGAVATAAAVAEVGFKREFLVGDGGGKLGCTAQARGDYGGGHFLNLFGCSVGVLEICINSFIIAAL